MDMTSIPYERSPTLETAGDGSAAASQLELLWATKPGLLGWLGTVDHKHLGKRYLITAFCFLVLGGGEALIMRLQLAGPNENLLPPELYKLLYLMHGIRMY